VVWAEAYLHTKWHLNPSSRFATIDMGRNWGYVASFWEGELGPHPAQCGLGHLDSSSRLATIDMDRKLGGYVPFLGRGAGSPSNTMSLGLRPTSVPSGILIHPAIWLQQIWAENWGLCPVGQGNGPIAEGELQTVAQKRQKSQLE